MKPRGEAASAGMSCSMTSWRIRDATFVLKHFLPAPDDAAQWLFAVILIGINHFLILLRQLKHCLHAAAASKLVSAKRAAFLQAIKLVQLANFTTAVWTNGFSHSEVSPCHLRLALSGRRIRLLQQ